MDRHVWALIGACLSTLSAGTNYAFSAYAPQVAKTLNISSTQLNAVGIAGNLGMYFSGPFLGNLVDTRGPRTVLFIAGVLLFSGYFLIYLIYAGGPDGPLFSILGVSGLFLGMGIVGTGSSGALSGAANGAVKNFGPQRRGTVISIVYGCLGISAMYYAYVGRLPIVADPTASMLLVLAFGCILNTFLAAYLITLPPPLVPEPHNLGFVPMLPPEELNELILDHQGEDDRSEHSSLRENHSHYDLGSYASTEEGLRARSIAASASLHRHDSHGDIDIHGADLFRQIDFNTLFVLQGACTGIGLMYINNVGTMTATLSYATDPSLDPRPIQAGLVSLLSMCNAVGRLSSGSLSDWFLHHAPPQFRLSRAWLTLPMVFLFFLSQLFASHVTRTDVSWFAGLSLPTAILGYAYGWLFGLHPILCLEWFGIHHLGSNMGILNIAPGLVGNLANVVFGRIFDSNVDDPYVHSCSLGRGCYVAVFKLTFTCAFVAFFAASLLIRRKRRI